jgi:mono/diheme cytochrome c family protein
VRAAAGYPLVCSIGALTVVLAACGSDGDPGPALSAEADAGRDISRANGCAACHGSGGDGGVGPPFTGLYGSRVELADGTTVVADEAYITESIRDPSAKLVDGYELAMPANDLSDDEIASVVAYIRELSTGASTQP